MQTPSQGVSNDLSTVDNVTCLLSRDVRYIFGRGLQFACEKFHKLLDSGRNDGSAWAPGRAS